jgi:hypothetical protein
LTVARDCYFQATGWRHTRRIQDWRWIVFVFVVHLCVAVYCHSLSFHMIVISTLFWTSFF